MGLEVFATDTEGIGGRIRCRYEDFVVEEVLLDGEVVRVGAEVPVNLSKYVRSGPWTWFILEKRGVDTLRAVWELVKRLGVDFSRVSWGGYKDAFAVTAQVVSVFGVAPHKLRSVQLPSNMCIKVPVASDRPFTPSCIFGNHFCIVIRCIELSESEIERRIGAILEELNSLGGLPSFYGHQRFGTRRPNTHLVGKYIVKERFEDAVMELIARPYPYESSSIAEIRKIIWESRDYAKALTLLPKRYDVERLVLEHLSKYPRDFVGALRRLPRNLLTLFIEAYQAYLFNKVLSRRLERGLPISKPVRGDFVALLDPHGFPTKSLVKVTDSNRDKVFELIRDGKAALVLNVFGYNTILADGEPGEVEREVLKEEELSLEDFKIKSMPELSSRGTIRPASTRILNFRFEVEEDELHPGYRRVTVEFTLRRGNYATILLREIMKPRNVVEAGY